MALKEYLGAIIMEIDGREVEIVSLDVKQNTGRRAVKTMNRTGRSKGFARGIQDITLSVTVAPPLNAGEETDWAAIEGAKITIYPESEGGQRLSYLDCYTLEVGNKYQVDGEARRDISMVALREVRE